MTGQPARLGQGPPGTIRSPGLIVLFYVITFGIYGLVWHWKTAAEIDRYQPDARASAVMRPYVFLALAAGVLIITAVALAASAMADLDWTGDGPSDEEFIDALSGPGLAIFGVAILLALTGAVLQGMGLWRVWTTTAQAQTALGTQAIQPGLLLAFWLSQWIGQVIGFIPILGALAGLAIMGLLIACYVMTQQGLNQVWRAHGAVG